MKHGRSQRLPGKFVIAGHKPVLWYVKDFRRGEEFVSDLLISPHRNKQEHPWGQGTGGVDQLIEVLTSRGELIVDPFAGTGYWGIIATSMGREWIGADLAPGGGVLMQQPRRDIKHAGSVVGSQRQGEGAKTAPEEKALR
jgi:hypothetical protein